MQRRSDMSGSGAKGECARSVPLLKSIHDKTRVRGCGNQTDALRFQMDRTGYLVELTGRQNLLHRLFSVLSHLDEVLCRPI